MNGPRAFPPLTATTTALLASPHLVGLVDAHDPLAFIRNGDGIVGLGVALRLEFSGPSRLQDAAEAWRAVVAAATVVDPVARSGTGLVAFGSFAFADESRSVSVLVVPSLIVGRRGDVSWVTRTGGGVADLPATLPPGDPFPTRFSPGLMTERGYLAAVASAVQSITTDGARKVVVARDLTAQIPDDADLRLPIGALAAAYPDTAFVRLMRTGMALGGRELRLMTGVAQRRFSQFTDAEVAALHRFLKTLDSARVSPSPS